MYKIAKKVFLIVVILFSSICFIYAQNSSDKRERRKNLTIKEWNTNAATKTRYLDHIDKYDENGFKIESIEYANYGMKSRITFEYNEAGKCIKEVEYDGHNKPIRIRKFEYYPDGSKKRQYNYLPSGKLETTKEFEYIFDK